jgi:hypothetical protein
MEFFFEITKFRLKVLGFEKKHSGVPKDWEKTLQNSIYKHTTNFENVQRNKEKIYLDFPFQLVAKSG